MKCRRWLDERKPGRFQRLAAPLDGIQPELRELIHEQGTVVGQRDRIHLPGR
jgi:hypothetical protein